MPARSLVDTSCPRGTATGRASIQCQSCLEVSPGSPRSRVVAVAMVALDAMDTDSSSYHSLMASNG
ncbi:MAG: hypothetical protein JW829_20705 [Pirellulales bacterium]|nr:hypothetical protein [Pirellulales bacterium]